MGSSLRRDLGRVGVWLGGYGWAGAEERELVAAIEALGYSTLWFGEAPGGREPFARAAVMLAASERLVVATGIANLWAREPATMRAGADTLAESFPGRFVLGVGVSHPPVVQALGRDYDRPLARTREYLAAMEGAPGGQPAPDRPPPRVLAALRPRMLELARDHADGAHPYLVPVEHTERARRILGPDRLLAPELGVVLDADRDDARRAARRHLAGFYLDVPSYVANLRWLGWSEEDLGQGGSDALVDALVAAGDEEAILRRVRAHLDAGADHVCVQPVGVDGLAGAREVLRRLAPALAAA